MVKVIVRIPDEQRRWTFHGSEREVVNQLRSHFPRETKGLQGLQDCIEALQVDGIAEVDYEVVEPNLDENLLPADYLGTDQTWGDGKC